jgi:hypothetical protein
VVKYERHGKEVLTNFSLKGNENNKYVVNNFLERSSY